MKTSQRVESIVAGLGVLAVFVVMFTTLPNPFWTIVSVGVFAAAAFWYAHVRGPVPGVPTDDEGWADLPSAAAFWSGLRRPVPKTWTPGPGRVLTHGGRQIAHVRLTDDQGVSRSFLMARLPEPQDPFHVRWNAIHRAPDDDATYLIDTTEAPDAIQSGLPRLYGVKVDPGHLTASGQILMLELAGDLTPEVVDLFGRIASLFTDAAHRARRSKPAPLKALTMGDAEPVFEPPVTEPAHVPVLQAAEASTELAPPGPGRAAPMWEPLPYEVTPYEMPPSYEIEPPPTRS